MQKSENIQDVCEALRAQIAALLDEKDTKGATERTEVVNREQIQRIRRRARQLRRRVARTS